MPEYLAPGVYVEEVSFRSKSIEGVGTTTTAFVGPTRYGPLYDPPDILTSLADYAAVYGDGQQLDFEGTLIDNYMWHAARAFFNEGGKRLYVKRIYQGVGETDPAQDQGGVADGVDRRPRHIGPLPRRLRQLPCPHHAPARPERPRHATGRADGTRRIRRRRGRADAGRHDDVPLGRVVSRRGERAADVALRHGGIAARDGRALEPRRHARRRPSRS